MALKTLTLDFGGGKTSVTRFTTNIQTVIDSLNRDNVFVQKYTYKKIAIDNIYVALGIKLKSGGIPSALFNLQLDFGNTYVDGYNFVSASGLVIDNWRIVGLGG